MTYSAPPTGKNTVGYQSELRRREVPRSSVLRGRLGDDRVRAESDNLVEDNLEVVGGDLLELLDGHELTRNALVEDADGGVHAGAVHGVAHGARVGEEGHGLAGVDVPLEGVDGARAQLVLQVAHHHQGDVHELVGLVVGEVHVVADARGHARDVREELVHPILVARQHHDEVLLLVLHHVEQNLDGLLAVVAVVARVVEVVRLVDEQHAAHGLLDHLLGLGGGVADVLADEVVAGGHNHVPLTAVAHALQDLAHAHRHRGLASAGSAGEAHVEGGDCGLEAELAAHLVENEQGSDFAHALLHRLEAHQVVVELLEDLRDAALVHKVHDAARRGGVGHLLHEADFLLLGLTGERHGVLALEGLLLVLPALDVALVQLVRQLTVVARLARRRLPTPLEAGAHA
mmetsp:Transcript_28795/g.64356  ORF Transcript_28795/g.64356 Transcript_28795/m.64356 type:complete len:402 (+) Transcript_28795:138-1343(+)